jgi:hypothetical protein
MSEQPKFNFGETVKITSKEYNGRVGVVVAIRGSETYRTYTVEFGDGSDSEIAEDCLSKSGPIPNAYRVFVVLDRDFGDRISALAQQ